MWEIRSNDGKRAVMYDPYLEEYFVLVEGANYNGKQAEVFQTDDPYIITEVWNMFGGSAGNFEIVEAQ